MNGTEIYFLVSTIVFLLWLLMGSNTQTRVMSALPTALLGVCFGLSITYGEINSALYWTTLIVTLIFSAIFSTVSIAGDIKFNGNLFVKFLFSLFVRLGAPAVFIWTIVEMCT